MSTRFASTVYAVLAWILAAVAILHMATTWRLNAATAFTRVWFFGSGLAMAQAAAFNLLHRSYGRTAAGLRWTTRACNLLLLGLAAVAGAVTHATLPERVFLLGDLAGLLLLSFTSAAHSEA
jgi:hypothetical protein